MRMVVLRDTAINLDHAVLAVYVDGEPQLLDNLRGDIVPRKQRRASTTPITRSTRMAGGLISAGKR